jgi:hypothetical protein
MNSLEVTDNESKAVQKTPNRVALADIEAAISSEHYMTGIKAMPAALDVTPANLHSVRCMMNGFVVIGKTAPADPANFNEDLGRKFAREDAIRQIWPLMGYALRDRLMGETA